jgi:hypothetical protein
MKRTKGKWTQGLYPHKNYPHRLIMTDLGEVICEVIEKGDLKEMDANADLLEASPDLLEACENALRIVDLWEPPNDIESIKECDIGEYAALAIMRKKIELAIKKAKQ